MSVRIELDRRGTVFTCLDYVTGRVFTACSGFFRCLDADESFERRS